MNTDLKVFGGMFCRQVNSWFILISAKSLSVCRIKSFLFLLKTDCRTALVSCLCAWDNRKDTILPDASRKRKTWIGIGNASRKAIKKIRKHDIKQYRCLPFVEDSWILPPCSHFRRSESTSDSNILLVRKLRLGSTTLHKEKYVY